MIQAMTNEVENIIRRRKRARRTQGEDLDLVPHDVVAVRPVAVVVVNRYRKVNDRDRVRERRKRKERASINILTSYNLPLLPFIIRVVASTTREQYRIDIGSTLFLVVCSTIWRSFSTLLIQTARYWYWCLISDYPSIKTN